MLNECIDGAAVEGPDVQHCARRVRLVGVLIDWQPVVQFDAPLAGLLVTLQDDHPVNKMLCID
jgi:hypothetical protein